MIKITLTMLYIFIIGGMLLNFENNDSLLYAQENVDSNIIPLLIPPYQVIQDLGSSDLNKFNVTYITNIP
jgi:hypothetical protein